MASLRFSDSLLRTKFAGRITEGIDRNTDEPRNESKSRFSRAESERSEANLSTSKIIYGKNGEKILYINNL
ncbi:hypothetical protein O8I41_07850 [Campylobacter lari]|uniref:hypothetical protein n=1 Tax=Campylobacter lari TaxID=201 RepID=UPI00372AFD80